MLWIKKEMTRVSHAEFNSWWLDIGQQNISSIFGSQTRMGLKPRVKFTRCGRKALIEWKIQPLTPTQMMSPILPNTCSWLNRWDGARDWSYFEREERKQSKGNCNKYMTWKAFNPTIGRSSPKKREQRHSNTSCISRRIEMEESRGEDVLTVNRSEHTPKR